MTTAAPADRYAVVGNPIAHSKSPQIHRLFAQQTGQALRYDALLVAEDAFAAAVGDFFSQGGKGLNITVPFKHQAWEIATHLSPRARRAGAVNTLMPHTDGGLFGDNTDGIGLLRDLTQNLGVTLAQADLLVIGAGGAARGVLAPLLQQHPARLHLANRTGERADRLAADFADLGNITASGLDAIPERTFDVIINASAAGLYGEAPPLPPQAIGANTWCYDMVYAEEDTAFMRHARQAGSRRTVDGIGMLVEQAAEAFHLWRGLMPQTAPVIAALRAQAAA